MNALDILAAMVHRIEACKLSQLGVIPWAAPVISFGDYTCARIATLGLNPSNREFVDLTGKELTGPERRFHTLNSLGINSWSGIRDEHLKQIWTTCQGYFSQNPYDAWFQALDRLIIGANATYYGMFSEACHLDLVPFATAEKWGELSSSTRTTLLKISGDILGLLLKDSPIEVLVLNGQSVIENLELVSDSKFQREAIPDWTLPRKTTSGVTGFAYTGEISKIASVNLGRPLTILGYSHNIQSSFGVTSKVRTSIQEWITNSTNGVLC